MTLRKDIIRKTNEKFLLDLLKGKLGVKNNSEQFLNTLEIIVRDLMKDSDVFVEKYSIRSGRIFVKVRGGAIEESNGKIIEIDLGNLTIIDLLKGYDKKSKKTILKNYLGYENEGLVEELLKEKYEEEIEKELKKIIVKN